jgi:DNA invertase Pin-like site-specific DNA recombinase
MNKNLISSGVEAPHPTIKVATYLRMSTQMQTDSPAIQLAANKEYAAQHGYEIVEIYEDDGKTGVTVKGRHAFLHMMDDVKNNTKKYDAILVLDVSRWGRSQKLYENVHYLTMCRMHNKKVIFTSPTSQLANQDGVAGFITLVVQCQDAGHYSAQLSDKVHAGQHRLVERGIHAGGLAGYGLRRMLLDERGEPMRTLAIGELKCILAQRVILIPGPQEEIDNVLWIYRMFVDEQKSETEIADILNQRGIETDLGREWNYGSVKTILTNEKYIGNNTWNKNSCKLHGKSVRNPEDMWVRCEKAFEAIVPDDLFFRAKAIYMERSKRYTNDEMLEMLRTLKDKHGGISSIIINSEKGIPSSAAFSGRFGGLVNAYKLIGYDPGHDYAYLEINRMLRDFHCEVVSDTIQKLTDIGAEIDCTDKGLFRFNNMFNVSIVVCRCTVTPGGQYRWKVRFDNFTNPDITIAIRMSEDNKAAMDYYIFPMIDFKIANLKLLEENVELLDSYRYDDLETLYKTAKTISIRDISL